MRGNAPIYLGMTSHNRVIDIIVTSMMTALKALVKRREMQSCPIRLNPWRVRLGIMSWSMIPTMAKKRATYRSI